LGRLNFSSALVSGSIPGVKPDLSSLGGKDAPAIGRQILGHDMSPQTAAAIDQGVQNKNAEPSFIGSMVLGSPDFQRSIPTVLRPDQ
jgi:hypothetical protein